ncbi:MAG: GYF domain-containing protein, partial [Planctomycetota bacterium]
MATQWFYQTGWGQQLGPVDSRELRRLAEAGIVRPDTLVRQGDSGRWVRAEQVRGLFQRTTPAPSLGATSPGDGNAALPEFTPNFDPDEWDEDGLEVFRCIAEAVNRLREGPPSRNAGTSHPFSLNVDWDYWDPDIAELLAQIGHAIEQLRAAMEDGEPFPSADFVFRIDESIYHDDLVLFVRRIQVVLNALREGQSPRAIDSQLMLFDSSETQTPPPPTRKDESSWQSLVVAARDSGQHGKAVELAEQAVREYPRSDWLWRMLGGELTKVDRLDEAENALDTAHRLNPKADWLWRHFAALHRKREDLEGEIESLETLCSLGVAAWYDLNQLGIAY